MVFRLHRIIIIHAVYYDELYLNRIMKSCMLGDRGLSYIGQNPNGSYGGHWSKGATPTAAAINVRSGTHILLII